MVASANMAIWHRRSDGRGAHRRAPCGQPVAGGWCRGRVEGCVARGCVKRAAVHDEPRAIRVQHAARRVELLPGAWAGARCHAGDDQRRRVCKRLRLQVPLWRLYGERELRPDWRDDPLRVGAACAAYSVARGVAERTAVHTQHRGLHILRRSGCEPREPRCWSDSWPHVGAAVWRGSRRGS